jgi:hypothetical protein
MGKSASLARVYALVPPATKRALPSCRSGEDCRYL